MSQQEPRLKSARHIAAEVFAQTVQEGDRVVDATLGTGQDCLLLCQLVGEGGKVYGFDVQQDALRRTQERLKKQGIAHRATLHLVGHERMAEFVQQGVRLAAFNLGWLPGSDKSVTTQAQTTLQALDAALELLAPLGMLVVCIYPGHAEGAREQDAILDWCSQLSPKRYTALWHRFINGGLGAPSCLVVEKIK